MHLFVLIGQGQQVGLAGYDGIGGRVVHCYIDIILPSTDQLLSVRVGDVCIVLGQQVGRLVEHVGGNILNGRLPLHQVVLHPEGVAALSGNEHVEAGAQVVLLQLVVGRHVVVDVVAVIVVVVVGTGLDAAAHDGGLHHQPLLPGWPGRLQVVLVDAGGEHTAGDGESCEMA